MILFLISTLLVSISVYYYTIASSKLIEAKKINSSNNIRLLEEKQTKHNKLQIECVMPNVMVINNSDERILSYIKDRYSKSFFDEYFLNVNEWSIHRIKKDEYNFSVILDLDIYHFQ